MTRSPFNDAMAVNPTNSRNASPAAIATFETPQSLTTIQQGQQPCYPRTTASSEGSEQHQHYQQRQWKYNEDVDGRAALRDDAAQGMEFTREKASTVEHSTLTTKETGLGGQAEEATENRMQNQKVRHLPTEALKKSYRQRQLHFKEWCIRKEYTDGDWVTREKFVAYARELTAPQSHTDNNIPRLSVKPLFVRSYNGGRFQRASATTVEAYMRAVRALYKSQCLVDGIIPNLNEDLGRDEVDKIMNDYTTLLKYTASNKTAKDGKDEGGVDEGVEDEHGSSDDEDNASREPSSPRERSAPEEETSKRQAEPLPTAPLAQGSEQQSEGQQNKAIDDSKRSYPTKGKRNHRVQSSRSQKHDQHFIFAGASQRHHLSHQAHWKEWCSRKRYADGYRVTSEKFIAYAKELTAREEYYDKNNPHLCIKPFIVNAHKPDARRASKATVRAVLVATRALYMDQCTLERVAPNALVDLAKTVIDSILNDYEILLKKDPSLPRVVTPGNVDTVNELQDVEQQDFEPHQEAEYQEEVHQESEHQKVVQQGVVRQEMTQHKDSQQTGSQSTDPDKESSLARLKKSMRALWAPQTKHSSRGKEWILAHRDRLRLAYSYFGGGTEADLSNLFPSQFFHLQIQPELDSQKVANAVAVMTDWRKPHGDSQRYSIFLREDDVYICPVGALAFFLLAKWTEKKSYPNFNSNHWTTVAIEFLNDAPKAGDSVRRVTTIAFLHLVLMTLHMMHTHADTRPYCAFFDLLTRSPSPAQPRFRKVPPIMLSTTLSQESVFSLPRNRILPPADLQRQLFPFIEDFYDDSADWKMWVENIMMDRPETTNRSPEEDQDNVYYKSDYPIIRLLLFVAGLRKVILQDFAAMLTAKGDKSVETRTGYDHVFAIKHPVLSSPAFRDFAGQLREAIAADVASKIMTATETDELEVGEETLETLQVQETLAVVKRATTTNIHPATEESRRNSSVGDATDNVTSNMGQSLSTDGLRPVAAMTLRQQIETESLLATIQELCARVASLEQPERPSQDNELSVPSISTMTTSTHQASVDVVSQFEDTTEATDVDMDVDEVVDANDSKNINSDSKEEDTERLLQENRDLRNKVAELERVNRELAEQNLIQQRQSSSRTPELPVLSTLAASMPRSRVVSEVHGDHANNRNAESANYCPMPVVQDHCTTTLPTATAIANSTSNQNKNSDNEINDNNSVHTSLQQEVDDLRNQLASLEQEEQNTLDYATAAIEAVEFLDNKVKQMEQSMHGLWSMIARNEAAKFAASVSASTSTSPTISSDLRARSPSLGLSSPPPVGAAGTSPFQTQHKDPYNRLPARVRINALPLRSRAGSTAPSTAATTNANPPPSSVHSRMRS
ncbi:hypothetical protein EC991_003768 [Linnemannia zychae]|nr:hypothetical protein EC991_003768 [Linnemannia zychae]